MNVTICTVCSEWVKQKKKDSSGIISTISPVLPQRICLYSASAMILKRRTLRPCACWLHGELYCWDCAASGKHNKTGFCFCFTYSVMLLQRSWIFLPLLGCCVFWEPAGTVFFFSHGNFTKKKKWFSFAPRCYWCLVTSVIPGPCLWWLHWSPTNGCLSKFTCTPTLTPAPSSSRSSSVLWGFFHPVVNKGLKSTKNLHVPRNVPLLSRTLDWFVQPNHPCQPTAGCVTSLLVPVETAVMATPTQLLLLSQCPSETIMNIHDH